MTTSPCIVVTDLDGSLLDHHSYSYQPAVDAMARLKMLGIPLVLNTSKTRAELAPLRRELDNHSPFIIENGSAIFLPRRVSNDQPAGTELIDNYYCRVMGCHYEQVLAVLKPMADQYRFSGFSEMSVTQLQEATGLSRSAARLALAREFSEPLLWQDSESARLDFCRQLAQAGLTTLQGGRFLHVLGAADKGQSLDWLRAYYQGRSQGSEVEIIALGDGPNDIAMLQTADVGVVIRSTSHGLPVFSSDNRIEISKQQGPAGWSEVVHRLLDEWQANGKLEKE